jgi:hypothetical protein
MLTERDKMFGDGNEHSLNEEEKELMEGIFERFIENLQNNKIEYFEYECNNKIRGIERNILIWEQENQQ